MDTFDIALTVVTLLIVAMFMTLINEATTWYYTCRLCGKTVYGATFFELLADSFRGCDCELKRSNKEVRNIIQTAEQWASEGVQKYGTGAVAWLERWKNNCEGQPEDLAELDRAIGIIQAHKDNKQCP